MKSDVMKSLKDELTEQVGWLLRDFGFTIINAEYDAESFGNSFVILVSPAFRLQLVRDRGQIWGEVASLSEPDVWWDLHWVSELIPGANPPLFELESVATFIRDNFALLSDSFGSGYRKTKEELKRREEERKQEGLRRFGKR